MRIKITGKIHGEKRNFFNWIRGKAREMTKIARCLMSQWETKLLISNSFYKTTFEKSIYLKCFSKSSSLSLALLGREHSHILFVSKYIQNSLRPSIGACEIINCSQSSTRSLALLKYSLPLRFLLCRKFPVVNPNCFHTFIRLKPFLHLRGVKSTFSISHPSSPDSWNWRRLQILPKDFTVFSDDRAEKIPKQSLSHALSFLMR